MNVDDSVQAKQAFCSSRSGKMSAESAKLYEIKFANKKWQLVYDTWTKYSDTSANEWPC